MFDTVRRIGVVGLKSAAGGRIDGDGLALDSRETCFLEGLCSLEPASNGDVEEVQGIEELGGGRGKSLVVRDGVRKSGGEGGVHDSREGEQSRKERSLCDDHRGERAFGPGALGEEMAGGVKRA